MERAKAVGQAWQAGDFSPLRELLDPEVDLIWSDASSWDCHNRDDVLRLLERLQQSGFSGTEIELIDAGDDVLVTVSRPRPPRGEGWPEEAATVITFRDGKAIHLWQFKTPDQALAAAQSPQSRASAQSPAERSAGDPAEYAVPILPSRNLEETLVFYERLGFRRRAPGDTRPQLSIVRGGIELRFYHAPELNPFAATATCYLRVPHADQLHQEWELIGVPLDRGTGSRLLAPADTDDGLREFTLIDKSGNVLYIGSSPA
jgi:ketosteroid isomerase-like protein